MSVEHLVEFLGGLHISRAAYIGYSLLEWNKFKGKKVKKDVASGRVDTSVCVKDRRKFEEKKSMNRLDRRP